MKKFYLLISIILVSTGCLNKKLKSNKTINTLLYLLKDQSSLSNLTKTKGLHVRASVMEKNLLEDFSLTPTPLTTSMPALYTKNSKNKKYISRQWTLTRASANDKLLVKFTIPSLSQTTWEFYTSATNLSKKDIERTSRFIGLAGSLGIKSSDIQIIDKTDKAFLIKFKKASSTGYSFISYTDKKSYYTIEKCTTSKTLCSEN